MRSKFFLLIIILLVAAAVVYKVKFSAPQQAGMQMPQGAAMPASVSTVIAKEVSVWNEFSGRLEAVDKVEVRPRVGGTIQKVLFQEGAIVNKGDVLFIIDQRPYQAELAKAEANFAAAKSQVEFASNEFLRAQTLLKTSVITQSKFDERSSAKEAAESSLKAAEAAVNLARLNLEYSTIKAPISGKISRAEITEGNLVDPAAGQILASIVSIDPIYAEFNVDEQTYLKFSSISDPNSEATKTPVEVTLAGENAPTVKGYMKSFDNQLDTKTGTIRARAIISNPEGKLLPGLFAKINLGSTKNRNAVLITDRAIGTDQDKKFVLVVNAENTIDYRPVVLGASVDGMRIIESGLVENEKIIVGSMLKFHPGMKVIPQEVPLEGTQSMAQELQETGAKTDSQKIESKE